MPRDTTTTIEAKWLGACKPDQKPGDIMMPGGIKMNIKDMEKLKGLMPKRRRSSVPLPGRPMVRDAREGALLPMRQM